MLLVTQTGLDRDNISSIGLNSLCAISQGQKNVLQKENKCVENYIMKLFCFSAYW